MTYIVRHEPRISHPEDQALLNKAVALCAELRQVRESLQRERAIYLSSIQQYEYKPLANANCASTQCKVPMLAKVFAAITCAFGCLFFSIASLFKD